MFYYFLVWLRSFLY